MNEWKPADNPREWGSGTPSVTKWQKEMTTIDGVHIYRETRTKDGLTETIYYGDDTPGFLHLDSLLTYLRDAGKIVLR